MNKQHPESTIIDNKWEKLSAKYCLTQPQLDAFKRYVDLLLEWNEKFNLTAITDPASIIQHHFDDSLAIAATIDFKKVNNIADIGTGAGFPSIPLKIVFPHLSATLIEVNSKKRTFLAHVATELGLDNITLYPHDWRTFLRTESHNIDYFFARASLQPEELVRTFKPTSPYKDATVVYWASHQWLPKKIESPFIKKEVLYTLDGIQRKYVFFENQQ
jgi:16S rRNA (guanine(527)-N(7))-methyltransferase RsmG